MKSDFARVVFALLAMIVAAAFEEMLPKVAQVGVPLLLALALGAAEETPVPVVVLTAAACGAFEDALGSLPLGASSGFYVLAAVAFRRLPWGAAFFAYPLYQLWLWVWMPPEGGLALRILAAAPLGAFALLVTRALPERLATRLFPNG